jgi:hypothetical protein
MSGLAQILPLAFVMIAGPQIISSFFFATSNRWMANSLAYVGGAALSVTTVVTIAYFVSQGAKNAASSSSTDTVDRVIESIVLALVLFLIVRTYVGRKQSAPPKWMSRLQGAEPGLAFMFGLVLLGVFPTDIASSIAAALHIAHAHEPWWHCLPFVGLTLLLLGAPAITVAALGNRALEVLPKVRDWMSSNSWIVSEVVLAFFGIIAVNSLVNG